MNESHLILYEGAKEALKKRGIPLKNLDAGKLQAEYRSMEERRDALKKRYHDEAKKAADLERKASELEKFMGIGRVHDAEKKPDRNIGNIR